LVPTNTVSTMFLQSSSKSGIAVAALNARNIFFRICLLGMSLLASAKSFSSDSTSYSLKKNIVFISFGGKENFGSVNYERIFSTGKKIHWSYSIGVQPFQPSKKFSVPASINAFTKGRLHHFEVDLAATFYMDKYHPYDGGWKEDFNKQLYLTPFFCYRMQGAGWLMLKTGIGPQFRLDPPSDNVTAFKTELVAAAFAAIGIAF